MPAEAETSCPPAEQLACFIDGTLAPAAVAALEIHLAHCDRCCSIVAVVPDDADARDLDGDLTEGANRALDREHAGAATRLGRYVLLERVGAGGMGVVWAAYDPELDRRVAIKLLHYDATGSQGAQARRRLVHEARAMARVSHPNIVAVYDVVEVDDRVFMIMELVAGRTLGAWLREQSRGWREIVEMFIAAGRGLAAAHDQGVVHRDFKPDNVLVGSGGTGPDEGRVRVGDFGLASTDHEASRVVLEAFTGDPADTAAARTAGFVGTPAYMAPEQFAGDLVDARTDQFAFCVALWEALYGGRPFTGTSVTALAASVVDGAVASPSDRRRVPARIERAVRRGLARDRGDRFSDMRALLAQLERAVHRRRARVGAAAMTLVIAGLVAAIAWPSTDVCASAPAWLDGGWTSSRRDEVQASAAARGEAAVDLSARLTDVIDARVSAMATTFATSCRAAFVDHTERSEDHDLRLLCLRRTAATVDTISRFAVNAEPAGLARAITSMSGLAATSDCDGASVESLEAYMPSLGSTVDRERVVQLSIAVERAAVLRALGDFDGAWALLEEPLTVIEEPGLGKVAAMVVFERAMLEQRAGGGAEDLQRALRLGVEANNPSVVYSALSQLVYEAGVRRNDLRAAETYAELAMAYVGPSRLGGEAKGTIYLNIAQARERAGDPAGAREAVTQALAQYKSVDTHTTQHRFAMYILLGLLEEQAGKLSAAEKQYQDVHAALERGTGPFDPNLAVVFEYLAIVQRKQGEFDLALASAERGLKLRRALLGPRHLEVAASLGGIGAIQLEQGRYDEAQASYAAAVALWRERGGHERNVALTTRALAEIERRRGHANAALLGFREALAVEERVLGASHPELTLTLLGIGECERSLDDRSAATKTLERALALADGDAEPLERAKVELALARVMLESGDSARGRELAEKAREDAADAPEYADSARMIADANALLRQ